MNQHGFWQKKKNVLGVWLRISHWSGDDASCCWMYDWELVIGVEMMLTVFGRWFWFYKSASGIPALKKSVVEELVSVEDTLLCDLKENVPRQESLYFCLCFFGICYRWHGSDQGWRTRNTPHRWVSSLVLVPGGLPGTDWSLAWDFSEFLQDSVSGTHGTRSHCLLIQRFFFFN